MRIGRRIICMVLSAVSLGAGGVAVAMGPGMMGGACDHQGPGGMLGASEGAAPPMMQGPPTAFIEARLSYLKAELGITEAQEEVWQSFAAAMKVQAQAMAGAGPAGDSAQSAPERIEQRVRMQEQQLSRMRAMSTALGQLYSRLSDEQKQVADRLFGGMHG